MREIRRSQALRRPVSRAAAGEATIIVPFEIPGDPEGLTDLKRRLAATRWNDAVVSDWTYGMERGFLRELIGYWRDKYDWAERRAALNCLPHFRATIDGYGLHFLHYPGRGPNPIPLILMNGWPSSFVEYQRLAVLLSQGEPSFEVVVPTHPGFGFSDRPTRPYQIEPSDLYPKLMTALGHDRFMVSGTDVGSGVATRIALRHPDRVIAAHVSAIAEKPPAPAPRPPQPPNVTTGRKRRSGVATRAHTHLRPKLEAGDFVRPPTAVAMWPKDIALAPRELAERLYNVQRYTLLPKGGHFPAWEQPVLYAEDLQHFAKTIGA